MDTMPAAFPGIRRSRRRRGNSAFSAGTGLGGGSVDPLVGPDLRQDDRDGNFFGDGRPSGRPFFCPERGVRARRARDLSSEFRLQRVRQSEGAAPGGSPAGPGRVGGLPGAGGPTVRGGGSCPAPPLRSWEVGRSECWHGPHLTAVGKTVPGACLSRFGRRDVVPSARQESPGGTYRNGLFDNQRNRPVCGVEILELLREVDRITRYPIKNRFGFDE